MKTERKKGQKRKETNKTGRPTQQAAVVQKWKKGRKKERKKERKNKKKRKEKKKQNRWTNPAGRGSPHETSGVRVRRLAGAQVFHHALGQCDRRTLTAAVLSDRFLDQRGGVQNRIVII